MDTNDQGEIVEVVDYYPYGNVRLEETAVNYENKYKYTGKELDDDTGLYYYGARYYNASIGRFISVDPWEGDLTDPQSFNKYSYVMNNPLKYVDPTGEIFQLAAIAVLQYAVDAAAIAIGTYFLVNSANLPAHTNSSSRTTEKNFSSLNTTSSSFKNIRNNVIADPASSESSGGAYVTPAHTPSKPVIADPPTWFNRGANVTSFPSWLNTKPNITYTPAYKPDWITDKSGCGVNMSCAKGKERIKDSQFNGWSDNEVMEHTQELKNKLKSTPRNDKATQKLLKRELQKARKHLKGTGQINKQKRESNYK